MSAAGSTELLLPGRFEEATTAYGYFRTVFDQVAAGERGPVVSITPSNRHVGVTRRDTFRPGFADAVRACGEKGYPVLVRGAGGGRPPPTEAPSASRSSGPLPRQRPGAASATATTRPPPWCSTPSRA